MPITDIEYTGGIFSCREHGEINADDARLWADHARTFASESAPLPIVALIDARDVQHITPDARAIFAAATAIDGLELAIVVAHGFASREATEHIDENAVDPHTLTFQRMDKARELAEQKAAQMRRG